MKGKYLLPYPIKLKLEYKEMSCLYTTDTTRKFSNVGLVNPDDLILYSSKKKTEGEKFDLAEAIRKIAANGDEVKITIEQKELVEDVDDSEAE